MAEREIATGEKLIMGLARGGARFHILHGYPDSEIQNPPAGASRLILEEFAFFKRKGLAADRFAFSRPPGLFTPLVIAERRLWRSALMHVKRSEGGLDPKRRAISRIGLIARLIIDLTNRIDSATRPAPDLSGHDGQRTIILNSVFDIRYFVRLSGETKAKTTIISFPHNIDWIFHQSRVGKGIIESFLISMLKKFELDCMRASDYVLCLTDNDRQAVLNEGLDSDKVKVWLPYDPVRRAASEKTGEWEDKVVIGYVGSNFEPNILAVQKIIEMADELGDDFIFLVMGSVDGAFKGSRLPKNVRLMGHVDDLHGILASCDAFLNPKIGSDTGAEIKMFDYLGYGKPIFCSPEGARGFEREEDVIICPISCFVSRLKVLRTGRMR